MENFILYNNQYNRNLVKYEEWLFINRDYIENIINNVLYELYKNTKNYKYEINEEGLIEELCKYLYEKSNTKYKKVQFI